MRYKYELALLAKYLKLILTIAYFVSFKTLLGSRVRIPKNELGFKFKRLRMSTTITAGNASRDFRKSKINY